MARGPSRDVTRRDVYTTMRDSGESRRPWTTSALAKKLPCSSDTVYNRLRELQTLGEVETKKVGSRARIWWIPENDIAPDIPDTSTLTSTVDRAIIEAMASRSDYGEAWTTTELEDTTGHDRDTIYKRLRDLEADNHVQSEKVGGRARVWWLPGTRTEATLDA